MNQSTLKDKIVVVTGASRGLGRALAVEFARAGALVYGTGRDAAALDDTAREVEAVGGAMRKAVFEVRDEIAVCDFFASLPRLDVLLNNAGIARLGALLETSTEEMRAIMEINVVGAFTVLREGARKMQSNGGGHIINIASDAATRGIAGMAPYVASKHALLGLGRSAHLELAASGVRVTSFCPGPIQTDILGPGVMPANAMPPEAVAQLIVNLAAMPPQISTPEILVLPV